MKQFFYPRLSTCDFGYFRIGGPGLANCLFLATRAYINSVIHNGIFIEPSWTKFSIGPWIRKEKDKRVYLNLFSKQGICGMKKLFVLMLIKCKLVRYKSYGPYDLYPYFEDLNKNYDLVRNYIDSITFSHTISLVDTEKLTQKIAIHVRCGDYPQDYRTPINWYLKIVMHILSVNPSQEFALFSDGTDNELQQLISIKNVSRHYYGNAFADIYAISKCRALIASDSTFSAWGAFIGRIPSIFHHRHFPPIFNNEILEIVTGDSTESSSDIKNFIAQLL